jgi:hypothetical protein
MITGRTCVETVHGDESPGVINRVPTEKTTLILFISHSKVILAGHGESGNACCKWRYPDQLKHPPTYRHLLRRAEQYHIPVLIGNAEGEAF